MSILIKLAVIGVLVSVAFCSDAVRTLMQYFDVRYLLAMVMVQPLVLASLVLLSVRYAVLIDRPNLSYFAAAKAVTLSQGLNLFLPARLSELLKATYLRNRAEVPMSASLSAMLLERTVDLIIVGVLGFFCIFFFAAMVNLASSLSG